MSGSDTGLDLESFLLLMRADLGAWALLGLGTLILGLLAWLSWGSRRALRKCLALSVVAHAGLVLYGSTVPSVFRALNSVARDPASEPHIRKIRVSPIATRPERPGSGQPETGAAPTTDFPAVGRLSTPVPSLDLATGPIRLSDPAGKVLRSEAEVSFAAPVTAPTAFSAQPALPLTQAIPAWNACPHSRKAGAEASRDGGGSRPAPPRHCWRAGGFRAGPACARAGDDQGRESQWKVCRFLAGHLVSGTDRTPCARRFESRARRRAPARPRGESSEPPIPLVHALPGGTDQAPPRTAPADLAGPGSGRSLSEVPRFYRSRLDANRTLTAQRGVPAPRVSKPLNVRWTGWGAIRTPTAAGTRQARYEDGKAVPGDDDFTVHCPPGQTCFGDCAYWEADTALTGLALLTYLGRVTRTRTASTPSPWATGSISCLLSKRPMAT